MASHTGEPFGYPGISTLPALPLKSPLALPNFQPFLGYCLSKMGLRSFNYTNLKCCLVIVYTDFVRVQLSQVRPKSVEPPTKIPRI